jgi:hypothetical protein
MLNTSVPAIIVLTGRPEVLKIETWAGPDAGKLTFIELYTSVGVTEIVPVWPEVINKTLL